MDQEASGFRGAQNVLGGKWICILQCNKGFLYEGEENETYPVRLTAGIKAGTWTNVDNHWR